MICIKRSPFSCPIITFFIWVEPLLRGHLSYKATFSWSHGWPLNTGLSVYINSWLHLLHPGYLYYPLSHLSSASSDPSWQWTFPSQKKALSTHCTPSAHFISDSWHLYSVKERLIQDNLHVCNEKWTRNCLPFRSTRVHPCF